MNIGSAGLEKGNLILNQGCSLDFTIEHRNELGNLINHSGSTAKFLIQDSRKRVVADLSTAVSPGSSSIVVNIPASATAAIPVGMYNYDIIITMSSGDVIRMLYGQAIVNDTISMDPVRPVRPF